MRIYVAGPYTEDPKRLTEVHTMHAREVFKELHSLPHLDVVVPHIMMYNVPSPEIPKTYWLAWALDQLKSSSVVYVPLGLEEPEVERSLGTKVEVLFANAAGIPVFEQFSALVDWCRSR